MLDSVRFEDIFNSIVSFYDKDIIVVFDNLDRLDAEKLKETWNTLQIFANPNSCKLGNKRPWILLPITKNAFCRIENLDGGNQSLSISKLFVRIFEIPALILTDWKLFFFEKFKYAFPNCDESICIQVYSIASHSLLKPASRTPRNAIRFINAMVAQALIYPSMSLVSIATYCYLSDAYEMYSITEKESRLTFAEFAIEEMTGDGERSQYLKNVESHNPGLVNDLSMQLFGQFNSEAAKEVFLKTQLLSFISGSFDFDINKLFAVGIGSWDLVTNCIEDELRASAATQERGWVFRFIKNLKPELYTSVADKSSFEHVMTVLINGIDSFNDPEFIGSGERISKYVSLCGHGTGEKLADLSFKELRSIVGAYKNSDGDDQKQLEAQFADLSENLAPILEALSSADAGFRNTIANTLKTIHFDGLYKQFVVSVSEGVANPSWVAVRPPETFEETTTMILGVVREAWNKDDQPKALISTILRTGILNSCEYSSKELQNIRERGISNYLELGSTQEAEIALWKLVNEFDLNAPCLSQLYSEVKNNIEAYRSYVGSGRADLRGAITAICSMRYLDDTFSESNYDLLKSFVDQESINYLQECHSDLVTGLLEYINSCNEQLKAWSRLLIKMVWNDLDYARRSLDECFLYFGTETDTECRIQFGKELARNNRQSDLIETQFSYSYMRIYCGALDNTQDETVFAKLNDWILEGIQSMNQKQWIDALAIQQMDMITDYLSSSNEEIELPALDQAIRHYLEVNPVNSAIVQRMNKVIRFYACNFECLCKTFCEHKADIKIYIKDYQELLNKSGWFCSLNQKERYEISISLLKFKKAYCSEWLLVQLNEADDPKKLYGRYASKIRSKIRDLNKLSSIPDSAKRANDQVLKLLT